MCFGVIKRQTQRAACLSQQLELPATSAALELSWLPGLAPTADPNSEKRGTRFRGCADPTFPAVWISGRTAASVVTNSVNGYPQVQKVSRRNAGYRRVNAHVPSATRTVSTGQRQTGEGPAQNVRMRSEPRVSRARWPDSGGAAPITRPRCFSAAGKRGGRLLSEKAFCKNATSPLPQQVLVSISRPPLTGI